MGLFGAFTVFLPLFLNRRNARGLYDPEKANGPGGDDELPQPQEARRLSRDSGDQSHEGLSQGILSNTPYRGIRRVHHNVNHSSDSSDDLTLSGNSLLSRIKSYAWPNDQKSNDIDNITPNYRLTPIISGIVIPFSILLEIPGLTERWYIRTENDQTIETKKNPIILEVGMAISIACALVANVCLLLRFLEKRVQTVTLLCIGSLTIHDIINIVTVTIFGVEHRFDDGFTYGEAYWMTLCSTIASTICNVSLIVDLVRTPDFSRRGSGLTRRQRSLMIVVIVLLVYIAFGALISSILLHLSFINGLYYSVVSIETIGFGDIVPRSTGARVWTCFYILFGVINVGVVIAMFRETVLEGLEVQYRRRMRKVRQRRRDARRFRRWEARWQRAVEFRLQQAGLPVWVPDEDEQEMARKNARVLNIVPDVARRMPFLKRLGITIKRTTTLTSIESRLPGRHKMHLNVNALSNAQLEETALEAGVPLEMFLDLDERRQDGRTHQVDPNAPPAPKHESEIIPALSRAHAAHAFRDNIVTGWPSHPQTPTQAQLGRMAAMLTKFAVAVAGRHAHAPGLIPDAIRRDGRAENSSNANGVGGSAQDGSQSPPTSPDREQRADPRNNQAQNAQAPPAWLMDVRNHPATKWLKDFSRGTAQRSAWTYENYVADMEAEEKKAYYVKLAIALILFFLFWTVGSGIFVATEGWTYGIAMYFCFCAFVTTGYGDFAPVTPAGRSVFVVWALFGVGTLTIVVSVLQEASSSRYKSALHSRVFDKAVKKYRKRHLQESKQRPRPLIDPQGSSGSGVREQNSSRPRRSSHGNRPTGSAQNPGNRADATRIEERLKDSQETARRILETLPGEIVRGARTFQEYMQYFVSSGSDVTYDEGNEEDATGRTQVPPGMKKLLDELAEMEYINERVKTEILQDEDARKKLVTSAERALSALADRDALAAIAAAQQQTREQPAPAEEPSPFENDEEHRFRSRSQSPPPLPRTQSEPVAPLHRQHVEHALTALHEGRSIEDLDEISSSSEAEHDPSGPSSRTAEPS
ncbi:hypothetical protein BD414DRAFT_486759 [Trametes punicea]|nr:hypothetical protein BD414DRAFT_486759 [Trametes punicea]